MSSNTVGKIRQAAALKASDIGCSPELIITKVREKYGKITPFWRAKERDEVISFINDMSVDDFCLGGSGERENLSDFLLGDPGVLTDSEATRMECWRDRSKPCSARRCMAWRVLRVLGPDMEPVELHRADDDGMIAMGRCSALPE